MIRDNFSKILREAMSEDSWVISEDQYDAEKNLQFESLFALSNGYMGIRGVQEEGNHHGGKQYHEQEVFPLEFESGKAVSHQRAGHKLS